jgi:hypothetical protein
VWKEYGRVKRGRAKRMKLEGGGEKLCSLFLAGEWFNDMRHGSGEIQFANGDVLTCNFVMGQVLSNHFKFFCKLSFT